jgi:CRISPR-associated protein Csd1
LFAVYEYAQTAALGRSINATVKDKFYGSASTTPESVFPLLDRGSVPHLAKLRKVRAGQAVNIEKQIAEIMERLSPSPTAFPKSLPPAQQALFALGYYHERNRRFATKPELAAEEEEAA